MGEPAMTDGRLENLSDRHDFVVNGASRRRLAGRGRLDTMHAIFLDLTGCDLGQAEIPEEGE